MSDDGTVGTGPNPVDVFAQIDLEPLSSYNTGTTIHADKFQIETARGVYQFKAEDDTLVIEITEGHDE